MLLLHFGSRGAGAYPSSHQAKAGDIPGLPGQTNNLDSNCVAASLQSSVLFSPRVSLLKYFSRQHKSKMFRKNDRELKKGMGQNELMLALA